MTITRSSFMIKHRNVLKNILVALTIMITSMAFAGKAYSQAEVEPWGNITGIRKHGQLFEFESAIKVVNGKHFASTAKERQRPHFKRDGDEQIVNTNIDSLFFKETVKDLSPGKIKVTLTLYAHADNDFSGVYFCVALPRADYSNGLVRLTGVSDSLKHFVDVNNDFGETAKGVEFKSATRGLKIKFGQPAMVMLKKNRGNGYDERQLYVALKLNGIGKGDSVQAVYTIKASGDIDKAPVSLTINTARPGRAFDGLGGNFRLQNPKNDPQVIDYCLQNLRVAYSRVEMPWRFWQPNKDVDPTASADSGKLPPAVKKAMEMAHRLDSMGIPVILSAWFPPAWAITGKTNFRPVNGTWGNPLNKDNMDAIYKSIADYILYLKSKHGVNVKLFSFNESDLGINVRVTAQEHDDFIKGCGAYFAAHGVATKMLLGDNSDATTYKFIYPALDDPDARQYIGAISFHSWRGWDTGILQKWADAATKLNVPLIVGEGSTDAAAWNYPDIFQEQTYALKEINLYTRLLAICQPESILQWQLTSDYSPLIGGGIFGNNEPLHPGQRFWNLKQLSITPKGLFAMPVTCDKANISVATLGDNDKNVYAIHLVNNGTTRKVTLTGLPLGVKQLQIYNTSKASYFKQGGPVKVKNGEASFRLPATSYTTLISQ
jgi:O-glycosyl hydrolase